ncbi:MAG: 16S rRNA (guanine(527)-N(7))-methyltransferase RsmG [Paracoccaceae bacterium]
MTEQHVSRETLQQLEVFQNLLKTWNARINLVSPGDLENLQTRHIADSMQVYEHAPKQAKTWLDLGSGAGFPGLICAIQDQTEGRGLKFTLVESDGRKAAFLREAARVLGIRADVVSKRIEQVPHRPFDIITARALAPLPQLLSYAVPFAHSDTVFLFPKGSQVESELTHAAGDWHVSPERIASRTDASGTLLKLTKVTARL